MAGESVRSDQIDLDLAIDVAAGICLRRLLSVSLDQSDELVPRVIAKVAKTFGVTRVNAETSNELLVPILLVTKTFIPDTQHRRGMPKLWASFATRFLCEWTTLGPLA